MCYTFNKRPVELVFCTEFNDVLQAIAFEKQVKGWSRKKKEAIIKDKWEDLKMFSECQNASNSKNLIKEPFDSAQGDSVKWILWYYKSEQSQKYQTNWSR